MRVGDTTPRGYRREDLFDAWETYLPQPPPSSAETSATSATDHENPNNFNAESVADDGEASATEANASATGAKTAANHAADVADDVADEHPENITQINDVADVADVALVPGERRGGNGSAADDLSVPDYEEQAARGEPLGPVSCRVTIKEIRPPALGPPGDDLNDFTV